MRKRQARTEVKVGVLAGVALGMGWGGHETDSGIEVKGSLQS